MKDLELLERLVDEHGRLAAHPEEFFKLGSPAAAFDRAREILASLVEAKESELHRGAATSPVVKWALEHRSAVLGEVCVIPLVGLRGPLGWVEARSSLEINAAATDWINKIAGQLATLIEELQLKDEAVRLRELLDGIVECIPHAIVAVDEGGRVVEMNTNAETLFGVRRIHALDEPLETGLPPALAQVFRSILGEVRARRCVVERETEHALGPKTKLPLSVTGSPLSAGPQGVVFLCRDLRASVELDKMRQLDAMKSDFIHAVTHALKTPLTTISGGLQLLKQAKLDADTAELVAMVDHGAARLAALVADILKLSRLEAGQSPYERKPVDLAAVVRAAAAPYGIVPQAVEATAPCDPSHARDIVDNLISNAVKYSAKGSPVSVRLAKAKSGWTIQVRDRGIGIPAADLPYLFEKFHRASNAMRHGADGTGLGLAITRRLAELQGWTVGVESVEGKGTTVTVTIS